MTHDDIRGAFGCCDPLSGKHRIARRLTALTDGLRKVTYEPDATITGDDDSMGHQFAVWAPLHQIAWLDDRQPEPLRVQLAARLREDAAALLDLARRLDGD